MTVDVGYSFAEFIRYLSDCVKKYCEHSYYEPTSWGIASAKEAYFVSFVIYGFSGAKHR